MSSVEALKCLRQHRDDLLDVKTAPDVLGPMLDRFVRSFEMPFTTSYTGIKYTRKQAYALLLRALTEV